MVPGGWAEACLPDDANDGRPLQRARRGLHAVCPLLRRGPSGGSVRRCLGLADIVAKVFLRHGTQILRAMRATIE